MTEQELREKVQVVKMENNYKREQGIGY